MPALEECIGVRLLTRTTRSVALIDAGLDLANRCARRSQTLKQRCTVCETNPPAAFAYSCLGLRSPVDALWGAHLSSIRKHPGQE